MQTGSQNLFSKGIIVPTGIHRIKGKEVLRDLHQEQVEFLQSIKNIQLAGISLDEMHHSVKNAGLMYNVSIVRNTYLLKSQVKMILVCFYQKL